MNERTRLLVELHARGLTRNHLAAADEILRERGRIALLGEIQTFAPRAKNRPPTTAALRALCRFVDDGGEILEGVHLERLARAPSPPLHAYGWGPKDVLKKRPAIAVIGSRKASPRGEQRAKRWGASVAERGAVVVSGGALGIDCAAHHGALRIGGDSVAVLGEPVGAFPTRALRLAHLGGRALLLTANGPWVRRAKTLWVSRNRLIAALSDAVIVVEGGARSGTRHTVAFAERIGVPVFAVPGDPDDPRAATPNELIKDRRATPLLHFDQLTPLLGASTARTRLTTDLSSRIVEYASAAGGSVDLEALAALGPFDKTLEAIAMLEIDGEVERRGNLIYIATS